MHGPSIGGAFGADMHGPEIVPPEEHLVLICMDLKLLQQK